MEREAPRRQGCLTRGGAAAGARLIRRGHDPRGYRGHLRIRAGGKQELAGYELFDANPCSECGLETAEPDQGDKHQHRVTCRACGTTQTHLLRALPCVNCPVGRNGEPTTALGVGEPRAIAKLQDGSYLLMGNAPQGVKWPWRYRCAACKRTTEITAAEFNRLRLLEPEEYLPLLPA